MRLGREHAVNKAAASSMMRISIRAYSPIQQSHSHDHHQLVMPLAGRLNLLINKQQLQVGTAECLVIPAGTEHGFSAAEQCRFLVVDLTHLPAHLLHLSQSVFQLSDRMQPYLLVLEQLLVQQNQHLLPAAQQFFLQLLEAEQPTPALDKRLRLALLYMQEHLAEELDLVQLASKASLSLSQFKQLFRQQLGLSPGQYLTTLRMQQGRTLVLFSNLSVQQIALDCGYQSASAFSARFLRHYGQSPQQYRGYGLTS
jgi:AraC-like DNA-binding protein/mannose-6-phosphate isomerase-like protein (cupin superfamily)